MAHEIRTNMIGGVIFLALTILTLWSSRNPSHDEVMQEIGATVLVVGDIALFLLITYNFIVKVIHSKPSE